MRDPFFTAPGVLIKAAPPLANTLALKTLPLHIHELLPAFCLYEFMNILIVPRVSSYLFPQKYPGFSKKTKINWNVHSVSFFQACLINTAALYVLYVDKDRKHMDWHQRVWGYSGATGMVQGFSAGYFLWDLMTSIRDVDVHGWGALAHAAAALTVSSLGFVSLSPNSLVGHDWLY